MVILLITTLLYLVIAWLLYKLLILVSMVRLMPAVVIGGLLTVSFNVGWLILIPGLRSFGLYQVLAFVISGLHGLPDINDINYVEPSHLVFGSFNHTRKLTRASQKRFGEV